MNAQDPKYAQPMSFTRSMLLVARFELRMLFRSKETWLWTFFMPALFFFFIGSMTGGFSNGGSAQNPDPLHVQGLADSEASQSPILEAELLRRLEQEGFSIHSAGRSDTPSSKAASSIEAGDSPSSNTVGGDAAASDSNSGSNVDSDSQPARLLTLPERMTERVLAGEELKLLYRRQSEGLALDFDQLRLWRACIGVLADLAVIRSRDEQPDAAAFERMRASPRPLTMTVAPAGKRKVVPNGFEQAVPGTMVMFTLLVLTTSGAVLLVIERRQGLLRRLACAPIRRSAMVLGKLAGKLTLGCVQIGVAMGIGWAFFDINWGAQLPSLFGLLLLYALAMASLGMLLGNLARSEGQAIGIGVLSANVLGALGGCWWPIEVVPAWMQSLANFLPTGWVMQALHKLVSFGASPASILGEVACLCVFAIAVTFAAVKSFRYQ